MGFPTVAIIVMIVGHLFQLRGHIAQPLNMTLTFTETEDKQVKAGQEESHLQAVNVNGSQQYRTIKLKNRSWNHQNKLRCAFEKDAKKKLRLNRANYGYDIWKKDPWADGGDPGVSNLPIFDTECKTSRSQDGYYDFFKVTNNLRCKGQLSARTISTFKDYMTQRDGSTLKSYDNNFSLESSVNFLFVSVGYSVNVDVSSERKRSYFAKKKLFEKKQGEVVLTSATCLTQDATFNIRTLRPKFDRGFIRALELINDTLSKSERDQEVEVKHFINNYGTHFPSRIKFGAKMIHEKIFTKRSKTSEEQSHRKDCSRDSAGGCGGYHGGMSFANIGASTKVEYCHHHKEEGCTNSAFDNSWGQSNGLEEYFVQTIGSKPSTTLEKWAGQDFHPVPIVRELSLITKLLTSENLQKNKDFGFSQSLDADGIRKAFNKVAQGYCQIIVGKSKAECEKKLNGCGLDSDCSLTEKCINDSNDPKGYRCGKGCGINSDCDWTKETCSNFPHDPKGYRCQRKPIDWVDFNDEAPWNFFPK